ncbi:MAG: hypothetical protein KC438_01275 [Thermomicrobiales bacterium]|nr:hypothetical protein [Thermomicrobiales bacterium]MCO5223343.1 hypothetical protein [Thermomicrobiales bacterium]
MPRETSSQDPPTPKGTNIRPKEERYGGEGHAGADPFKRPRSGDKQDTHANSPVEVPDATVEDLVQQPDDLPATSEGDLPPEASARQAQTEHESV